MQPDLYRTMFKPRHRMLCDYVHSHSSMHTFLHSCGSIDLVVPDLIDAGFEILNPCRPTPGAWNPTGSRRISARM
jgi:uroporphyrinogen decarboxylase